MDKISYVGFVVSPKTLEIALPPDGQTFKFNHDQIGLASLLKKLPPRDQCVIVFEATGGAECVVVAELLQAGCRLARAKPAEVRHFATGMGRKATTDSVDAAMLFQFGSMRELPCLAMGPGPLDELQQLVQRRQQLLELHAQETVRLGQTLAQPLRKSMGVMLKLLEDQVQKIESAIARMIHNPDGSKQKSE